MSDLINLRELAAKWRDQRAHTYASENADHYRGFDAGRSDAATELERWIEQAEARLEHEQYGAGDSPTFLRLDIVRELLGTKPKGDDKP